jgi:hypothetical protein
MSEPDHWTIIRVMARRIKRGWYGYATEPTGRTVATWMRGSVVLKIVEDEREFLLQFSDSDAEQAEHSCHSSVSEAMAHAAAEYGVSQRDWVVL